MRIVREESLTCALLKELNDLGKVVIAHSCKKRGTTIAPAIIIQGITTGLDEEGYYHHFKKNKGITITSRRTRVLPSLQEEQGY